MAANHRSYRGKVTLQYDKMILDNKEHCVINLSQLPSEISPMLACKKSNGTVGEYFGEHSPSLTLTVVLYKARMFDDMHLVKRILKVQTPRS